MKLVLALVPIGMAALLAACGSSSSSTDTGTSSSSAAGAPSSSATSSTAATTSSSTAAHQAMVTLTPTHGKVGSVIHVVGSGYSPGVSVTGTICTVNASGGVDNPLMDCDVVNTVTVTTDASGGFATDFTIKRIPTPMKAAYTIGFGVQGDNSNSAGGVLTIDK